MSEQKIAAPASQEATVTQVDWSGAFEFVHLFKAFRLAIHPVKMVAALLAIVLVYFSGTLFDFAWGPQVYSDEIESYQMLTAEQYHARHDTRMEQRDDSLQNLLSMATSSTDERLTFEQAKDLAQSPAAAYRKLRQFYIADFHKTLARLAQDRKDDQALGHRDVWATADAKPPAEIERRGREAAAKNLQFMVLKARDAAGRGIFEGFLDYELKEFDALVDNTMNFIRVGQMQAGGSAGPTDLDSSNEIAVSGGLFSRNPARFWRSDTILGCLANMTITGPCWLFAGASPMQWRPANAETWRGWAKMWAYRLVYLATLLILAGLWLVLWALAGAVLCRLAALEFAGKTDTRLGDIKYFARRKVGSFIKAPLMPLGILLIIALLGAILSVVGAVPFLGEIVFGLLFILFLVVGFILMLVVLGMVGSQRLFYPAMAVEGSDNFDALSRGFSYLYARPWRLVFYTVVSLIYGTLCFLFITLAVYLILALTHWFAGFGVSLLGYAHGWYSGSEKLDTLWPAPRFGHLWAPVNWWAMSWTEYIGSWLLHVWMFVLLCSIAAFVVTFYFSSNTILYFLLRRSVDGQSLMEIYDEEVPEAPVPTPPVASASTEIAEGAPPIP